MPGGAHVHVEDPRFLHVVNAFVHDQWFEADEIAFDAQEGLLQVPFQFEDATREEVVERTWRGRAKRTRVPLVRALLTIAFVTDWELADTEEVGTYDFNELVYEPATSRLRVTTNIPLVLSAAVSRVDVRVELTDEQIGFRPVRYFAGGADMRTGAREAGIGGLSDHARSL